MRLFLYISDFIVPFMILSILIYGIFAGVNVYDTFIQGAKRGFWTVVRLMPTLIGLMAAVGILRASGFLEFISEIIGNVTEQIGFPGALVPLTIVKMFSSSAATGLLLDIYKEFGTDSHEGFLASVLMCCSETIFYTISVYFIATGDEKHSPVTKMNWTLAGALTATFAGMAASVWLCRGMG